MFKGVCSRVTVFCLLVFSITANAAMDGFVKAANPNLDAISTRFSSITPSDKSIRNNYYQVALAVPVTEPTATKRVYQASETDENEPTHKPAWWLACGLAFISVMKRRLNR
jgi:hypothetical protein